MFICYPFVLFVVELASVNTVPPTACFAKFRWDDCGKPPVPVIYYWRPGSRCEVGLWRGCLPNMNMFSDEYECVATCIYTSRASASDYHSHNVVEEVTEEVEVVETTTANSTEGTSTETVNATVGSVDVTTVSVEGGSNDTASNITATTVVA